MSINATIDDYTFQVASASGWAAFCKWVRTPALKLLAEKGTVVGTDTVALELKQMAGPTEVMHTASQMAEHIGIGDAEEAISIWS